MSMDLLSQLVRLREQVQKQRIQMSNRLSAIERGDMQATDKHRSIITQWHERFLETEQRIDTDIGELVLEVQEEEPIFEHVQAVKGIGPILAARLLVPIDFERAPTVSALWRFCGLAVVEGQRERKRKGEKMHYSESLKSIICGVIASSMLKANSPYRTVYDSAKEYYTANRPDWTKAHVHRAAIAKMMKMFLSHLWERGRVLKGLPIRYPYVQEKLGHTGIKRPVEFGWSPLNE